MQPTKGMGQLTGSYEDRAKQLAGTLIENTVVEPEDRSDFPSFEKVIETYCCLVLYADRCARVMLQSRHDLDIPSLNGATLDTNYRRSCE